jgi:hypothetical protein
MEIRWPHPGENAVSRMGMADLAMSCLDNAAMDVVSGVDTMRSLTPRITCQLLSLARHLAAFPGGRLVPLVVFAVNR